MNKVPTSIALGALALRHSVQLLVWMAVGFACLAVWQWTVGHNVQAMLWATTAGLCVLFAVLAHLSLNTLRRHCHSKFNL